MFHFKLSLTSFCTAKHAREIHNQNSITSSFHLPKARWKSEAVKKGISETKQPSAHSENKQLIFPSGKVLGAIFINNSPRFQLEISEIIYGRDFIFIALLEFLHQRDAIATSKNVTSRISKFSCECSLIVFLIKSKQSLIREQQIE